MSEQTEKRGRGRPTKYPLEQIEATPDELARALFDAAEKPEAGDDEQADENLAAV